MTEATATQTVAAPPQIKPDPARVSSRVDAIHVRHREGGFVWSGEVPALMSPMFNLPEAQSVVVGARVLVIVRFEMSVFHTKDGSADTARASLFQCSAEYFVQYELRPGDASSEDAELFAMFNGPYTCYPYWREYVNNALIRCGMPSMSLPPWVGGKMSARPFTNAEAAKQVMGFLALASQLPNLT